MNFFTALNIVLAAYALFIGSYFWAGLCVVLAYMCSDWYNRRR